MGRPNEQVELKSCRGTLGKNCTTGLQHLDLGTPGNALQSMILWAGIVGVSNEEVIGSWRAPLGRWGRVEEVGHLALYLYSEDAGLHQRDGYSHRWWLDGAVARPKRLTGR